MATRIDQIMSQYSGGALAPATMDVPVPELKKSEVEAASALKKQQIAGRPSPQEMYQIAAARHNDTGSTIQGGMQDDLRRMNIWDFYSKYGSQTGSIMGEAAKADNQYLQDKTAYQSTGDAVTDTIRSVGMGLGNTGLSIGALGAGAISARAGTWMTDLSDRFNARAMENQSAGLNARRAANAVDNQLDYADNNADYVDDVKTDGKFVASLKRIGRDAWDAGSNVLGDSALTLDLAGNAAGSLITAGPIGEGLGLASRAAIKALTYAKPSLLLSEAAGKAYALGSKLAMPASIGLQEGAGAYQQATSEAMAALADRSDLTDDQKAEIANNAGIRAAQIQAPIGALTGVLTSKFEAHPFHVGNVRATASNLFKEAAEEAIQGGSGQFASNTGIKQFVDQNKDVLDGVGEQVGLGAIGGIAAAGAVQTPGVLLRTAVDGAKLAVNGTKGIVKSAMGAVDSRNQTVLQEVANASPVSAPRMDDVQNKAVVAAPVVQAAAVQAIEDNKKLTPTEKTEATDYTSKLFDSVKFDDAEADNQIPVIGETIRGSTDRFDAMRRVSDLASNEGAAPHERLAAGLYLMDTIRNYQEMIDQVPEAIQKMDDSDPALDQVRAFEDVLLNIQSHPKIKEAIQAAIQFDHSIKTGDISPDTPQGQENIQTAVQLASLAPEKSDPEVNDQILFHAEQGKIQLSPTDVGILKAANAVHQADQTYSETTKKLGLTNTQAVSKEIQDDETNSDTLHKSALAHMEAIFGAMRTGNPELAGRRLQHFMNFAQSMQNKVAALNENFLAGDGDKTNATPYEAYNPRTGKFYKSDTPVFLNGKKQGQIKFAQVVAADAAAVAYIANETSKAFPELKIKPVETTELHEMMRAPAREAARDYLVSLRDQAIKNKESQTAETKADREEDPAQIELPLVQPEEKTPAVPDAAPATGDLGFETEARQAKADRRAKAEATPVDTASGIQTQKDLSSEEVLLADQEIPAKPETVAETPVENNRTESEVAPQVPAIDQTFPNLLGSIFKDSFKLPNGDTPISRLIGTGHTDESSFDIVTKALSSVSKFRNFIGKEGGSQLTEAVSKAYQKYIRGTADYLSEAMDTQLQAALAEETKGKSLLTFINEGGPAATFVQNRALNITESVDGDIRYNRELKENAILAGLQWLITADQRARDLSDEDVAKILRIPVTSVTNKHINQFNQGLYFEGVVSELSNVITRYWGVVPSKDVGLGLTKGVPEGVAKEVLRAMDDAGLIKINPFNVNYKTYIQVALLAAPHMETSEDGLRTVRVDGALGSTYDELMKFPTAIEHVVSVEPEEVLFIGSPPEKVSRTQLRNPLVKLTDQQTKMIEAEQGTKHYINQPMVDFITDLGEDAAVELFGYGDLNKKSMNKNHRQSLESINLTIRAAVRSIQNTFAAVENKAQAEGKDIADMPVHYAYEFTSVNRLQMIGKHNPQANKLTREAILPTRSTLDLTDDVQMGRFMLAMAQAWGLKVHKQPRAKSVEEAVKLAAGDYAPVIQLMQNYLTKSNIDLSEHVADIRKAFGNKPVPAVALHAAMEYARYLNERNKGNGQGITEFTTHLYVEADGITDGPINAMVHTATGEFTPEWLEVVGKGGLFFGQPGMTANMSTDTVDLYQHTTDFLKERMREFKLQLLSNTPVKNQMDTLLRVMDQLLPDIAFDSSTEELEIKRGAVKNPLTVTIYGAGAGGIANKITAAVTKAVYERESERLQFLKENPEGDVALHFYGASSSSPEEARAKYKRYTDDMSAILNNVVVKNEQRLEVTKTDIPKNNSTAKSKEDFTLLPQQVENLQKNIGQLFVGPMREAIAASIGETDRGVLALRQATQVQSIYLQYAFQRAMAAELAKKDNKTNFLSQKEIQGLYDKLKHLAPFIETGTQNMLVSGSDRVSVPTSAFSRALNGNLSTPAYVFGPQNSGVSGIPLTIIGTGDGQMMQNVSTMDYAPEGTLKVFDGMHMKLSTIEDDARKVNEAVYQGWMANPLGDVAKSFSDFVRDVDLEQMDAQQQKDLGSALFGPKGVKKSKAAIVESIQALNEHFQTIAQEIQARKNALARVQMTVDHMASAESPFDSEGVDLTGRSNQEIIDQLNAFYAEEYSKLNKAEKPSENISKDLPESGSISGDDALRFVNKLNVPENQKAMLLETARAIRGKGWSIEFGSNEDPTIKGQTNFSNRTISVFNGSAETLLHEMIHATTMDQVSAYYQNDTSLEAPQAEAVARIESLMQEWLDNEDQVSDLNPDIRQAYANAQTSILAYLGSSQKAAALNEFMAWTLSNQSLSRVAERTKAENPLSRIVKSVLAALKSLIFGGKAPKVDNDIYSNLRFNTLVLMRGVPTVSQNLNSTILFQSEAFGSDDRLTKVREQYFNKIASWLKEQPDPAARLTTQYKSFVAKVQADAVQASFDAHGFPMNMQQASTFQMIVTALATEAHLNPNSLSRAQELFAHVSKNLKVETFMADPESSDPAARFTAQEKYNSVLGVNLTEIDEQGRSTLLPAFIALSVVDDGFRNILSKMRLPEGERMPNDSLDNRLTNFGTEAMDRLDILMSGEGLNKPSVQAALNVLTDKFAEIADNQKDFITQVTAPVGTMVDAANNWVVDKMTQLSQKASDKLENVKKNTSKKSVKVAANFGQILAGVVNETIASDLAKSGMSLLNKSKVWTPIHEIFNELVGRTDENAPVYDMIKEVRSAIQQMRQQFREHLPELIQKRFTRELSELEWSALYNGLGRTDLASLRSGYSSAQIKELLVDPSKISQETVAIEARITSAHPQSKLVIAKAKELAGYMINGRASNNLLRNAVAIANLYNEGVSVGAEVNSNSNLIRDIDHLVSLYALDGLEQTDKAALTSLVQEQNDGVSFVLSYIEGQRNDELNGSEAGRARVNHYKGYVPSIQKGEAHGRTLIVASDEDYLKLRSLGFNRVADYEGMHVDRYGVKQNKAGYYFSTVSGRSVYNQGILQTVHTTVSGVDPVTGFTTGKAMAGRIVDPAIVERIKKASKNQKRGNEPLLPVFNEDGEVVAYERSLDPVQEARLQKSTNLADMLGVWRGRQAEELLAEKFNETLIDRLQNIWEKEELTRRDEYVNLFDKKALKDDKILADAVKLIPRDTRSYITKKFGDGFWVRRDMLNDAIGYRAASVGDAWTGNTRFSEETQKNIRQLATGVFGIDAYKRLVQAEKLIQNVVTDARVLIVVKSVIVPFTNLIANIYQLSARGVPLAYSIKNMPKKTSEVNGYIKGRVRKIELEAELRAATGDPVATRKLSTELQSIEDNMKRLSIWPLIEAGEFTSVSDVGLGKEEIDLAEGKLNQYIEKLTDKLPDAMKTAGKYAIVGKDTALFKGLQRSVEYGDFLAKAILFDDLTLRQGVSQQEALTKITEEYVNYDRLAGRGRDYLEKMGMIWFWNFKIRSAKIGLSMIRNNPVHTMLSMLAPTPPFVGSIGNPVTDNIFTVMTDGRLGHSIGPWQGLRAHSLNPWLNLID